MSLTDDINNLPDTPHEIMPGHLNHHATIHSALKKHNSILDTDLATKTDLITLATKSDVRPGSGYKIVPLSVTLGNLGNTHLGTTGHYRFPLLWNAPITRWRMCVTTRSPQQGNLSEAHVRLDAVTMGDHAGQGAFTGAPIPVAENIEVPLDGSIIRLPWITGQIGANVERLIGVKYTSLNDVGPLSLNGECYDMGTAGPTDPTATGTRKAYGPLDIWIEAETYATTPTFAVIGDSTSCGAGATRSTNDGWINVWARQIGALPIHYATSGDSAWRWSANTGGYKQTRWLDLAPPDAVIFALGNNDFAGTATLAIMQTRIERMMPDILNISPNLYAATTKPRAVGQLSAEQIQHRNEYNAWLKSERTLFRDVFDWAEAVDWSGVVDGGYLDPKFDSGDGIHLNTLGYAQLAAAMRTVTTPPARTGRNLVYTGTGTPSLSSFPDAQIGDYIVRKSDGQEWRVEE